MARSSGTFTPSGRSLPRSTVPPVTLLAALDLLLVLGLTLRLTRLIVTDDLGLWWVRGPASFWAMRHDTHQTVNAGALSEQIIVGWRSKLSVGLSCPFCIGWWVGCAVLASLAAVGGPGDAAELWRWIAGAFSLNWIAAHIGSRLGDAGYAEETE